MLKEIRKYLKERYKVIENVIDVNNNRYDAKPVFIKDSTNALKNSIHTTDTKVGDVNIRIYKSSPISQAKAYFIRWCYIK